MMISNQRFGGLDSLRGCAVLAIIIWHYVNNTGIIRGTPAQEFTQLFFFGVDLFFVLSGFLIGGSLMAARGRPDYWRSYVARRAGRIFPLYYAWLGLFVVALALGAQNAGGALPWLFRLDGFSVLSYATFTQNLDGAALGTWGPMWFAVTWSLAIEVHFYIIVALVVYALPVRWVGLFAVAAIAASLAYKIYGTFDHAMMVSTLGRIDMPFVGVLFAWLWRFDWLRAFVTRYPVMLRAAALALFAAFFVVVNYRLGNFLTPVHVVFGVLVLAFAGETRAPGALVSGLRWCGVRCYGIYIFHPAVIGLVSHVLYHVSPNPLPDGGWPAPAIAFPLTLALAAASWRYFEWPIMQWVALHYRQKEKGAARAPVAVA